MKNFKEIGKLVLDFVGSDNNRFFALLLFTALMFALWIIYKTH